MTLGDLLRRLWRDDGGDAMDTDTETAPVPTSAAVAHDEAIARVTAELDDMEREVAVLAAQARLVRAVHDGSRAHGH